VNIKIVFRRTVDDRTMNMWYELLQITGTIQFLEEEDAIIW
jgi:hypothetical protein